MFGSTPRILIASFGLLSACLTTARAQQYGGVIVRQGGIGSAVVSGPNGTQGLVVDSQGRVRRFHQNTPAGGNAVGAFSGGGSGGIVTGDFDPFNFVFGQRGFPGPRLAMPGSGFDLVDTRDIETAYFQGDFPLALQKAESADRLLPGDPEIQQLHALALFATGQYPEAGRALRDVLDSGLTWTWPTLRRLYTSNEAYLEHYQALHLAASTPPASADTMILLAYHDLVLGRLDAARQSIQHALTLKPDDPLAHALLGNLPPDPSLEPRSGL